MDETPLWTDQQVESLNGFQTAGQYHPFTCPGNKPQCHQHRELIATNAGWICACGEYTQAWAHGWMLDFKDQS